MQLVIETAEIAVLKEPAETGPVDGVTTHRSLIARSGRPFIPTIADICGLIPGPPRKAPVNRHGV